jgi:hypothetical protein
MKRALALAGLLALLGCDGDDKDLDREALMNPQSCQSCHAQHYREWSGSMHAYAADDPVFLAMNARGQRETGGALGDFCVRCHAPMAVLTGATTDGLNLASLPQHLKGVTCYFCHTVDSVDGAHNNPLRLADDDVMRAAIADPVESSAHHSGYSALLDRDSPASAAMCGSCHDIVTPKGVHLERTFSEWQNTQFGNGAVPLLSCSNCHMPGYQAPAADAPGVKVREVHHHSWPAVDVALTPFAEMEAQLALVEDELDSALVAQLCVSPPLASTDIEVVLENAFAGHSFPSGAAQDRRAWVELLAYVGDSVIFESGVALEGEPVAELDDPALWLLRDRIFDEQGDEVHMFWEAASYQSELLPQATAPGAPHTVSRVYSVELGSGTPDRVTLRVLLRPMGLEVLQSLVASGDLESMPAIPTFVLVDTIEWTLAGGYGCVPEGVFGP